MPFLYTPPGVRITERPRAAAVALGTVPLAMCIVGIGDKLKQAVNEPVIRGQILGETLTVAGASPHTAALAETSNEETNQTTLYRDGAPMPLQAYFYSAPGQITINDLYYSATSVFTLDYVATTTSADELANADVDTVRRVGSSPGLQNFISPDDFTQVGDTIAWAATTPALLAGTVSEPFDLSTVDTIKIAVDGRVPIEVTITGAVQAAVTAAEVVADINAALSASPYYGVTYGSVAGVGVGNTVELTSPTSGETGSVELLATSVPADDATTDIFGLTSAELPFLVTGVGKSPSVGTTYYATYTYDRPATEYNTPVQVFNSDDAIDFAGPLSLNNQLAIAADIAFLNGAPSIYMVVIKDAAGTGIYTDNDYITGIQATEGFPGLTEIVALSPRLQVQTYLQSSVTSQSASNVGNRRRGWFGMARDTVIGNTTTPNSFVFRSAETLQVDFESPGRGRFILVAPCNVSRNINLADGTAIRVLLDGTYLAAAVAAIQTSFTSVSQTLLRKTVQGFNIDDFQTYLDQESNILGANGVTVIRPTTGNAVIVDPITTEGGGARDPNYMEISARTQADLVATFLEQRMDATLIGAVPESLSGFTTTAKGFIGTLLNALITAGEIGPYEDENGVPRPINYATDIIVTPVAGDRTSFKFKFFIMAKFPVKRLSGEFSVGGPVPTA